MTSFRQPLTDAYSPWLLGAMALLVALVLGAIVISAWVVVHPSDHQPAGIVAAQQCVDMGGVPFAQGDDVVCLHRSSP